MEGIDDSHRLAFAANHLEVFDNILGVSNEAVEDADLDVGDVPDLESKYGRFYKITTKEVDASSDEWIIIPNTFENNLIDGCQRMRK